MTRNRAHLMPDERENVDTLIAGAQEEIQTGDSGHIANKAVARLASVARRGEGWTRTALEYFAEEGLRRYVVNEMKAEQSHIRNADTGQVVTTPSRVGIQARNDYGLKENWEQRYWWELSWLLFTEKVRERAIQRDALDTKLAAFRQVLKLRERFPETQTVEEACEMAGIDPRSFGIKGDAFAV